MLKSIELNPLNVIGEPIVSLRHAKNKPVRGAEERRINPAP
jgi:hypothetical protein